MLNLLLPFITTPYVSRVLKADNIGIYSYTFEKYFNLHYDEKSQAFILPEERCSVVERELDLAGYFCIVTSEKMSAKEAGCHKKRRDPVSSCKKWAVI